MGRIKSVAVKNLGDDLIVAHGKKFTTDFDKNKKILGEVKKIKSKRTRNFLAGYITKQMQNIKKAEA
ncbi:MAG: 30S ribosomal protein S17e [Candidatus Aenigmarchaeota archaeon]|jgi:small subunit ribosomal protein S17e|nr:30S ribosomal protein S17e [Candidatus Aenigmarchaeota archaeon]